MPSEVPYESSYSNFIEDDVPLETDVPLEAPFIAYPTSYTTTHLHERHPSEMEGAAHPPVVEQSVQSTVASSDTPASDLRLTHNGGIEPAILATNPPVDFDRYDANQSVHASVGERIVDEPVTRQTRVNPPVMDQSIDNQSIVDRPIVNERSDRPTMNQPMMRSDRPTIDQPNVVDQERVRLLQEKLIVDKRRRKVGEVIVRKEVETQIKLVEVPVRRERLVVEQVGAEPRQLFSIDLAEDPELSDGIRVANRVQSETSVGDQKSDGIAAQSSVSPGIGIKAALWFMSEVLKQPQYQNAEVRLEFEDAKLQAIYQKWVEQYLATLNRPDTLR